MSETMRPPAPELSPDELLTCIEFGIHGARHRGVVDWAQVGRDATNVEAAQGLGYHGIPDGDGRHRAGYDEEEHR